MRDINKYRDRYVGRVYSLRCGVDVKIIQYHNSGNVIVQSLDKDQDIVRCEMCQLKRGSLKTPHAKVVCGVGSVGKGPYKPRPKGQDKCHAYRYWSNMLNRVYNSPTPPYQGVSVSDDWLIFQNYANWFYGQVGWNLGWHVDKDIVGDGKYYSEDMCIMVPAILNQFATTGSGNNLPLGVHRNLHGKYVTQMSNSLTGVREGLGYYSDPETAHTVYRKRKREHLCEVLKSEHCAMLPSETVNLILSKYLTE